MKIATSHSTDSNPAEAVNRACDQLQERLGEAPSLIFAHWSVPYDGHQVSDLLATRFPESKVHGGTSCLGSMTEEGFISHEGAGIGLMGICDRQGDYGVAGSELSAHPRQAAAAAVNLAIENAERFGELPTMIRVTSAPGQEEEIIRGIEGVVGTDVPIIGGSAGDNTIEGHWQQLGNRKLLTDGVVVSVLYPSVETSFAFHSGYSPTGTRGLVTRADGRVLHEIDGRPAAQVYNEWTGGAIADALPGGGNVLGSTTLHPIGRVVGEIGGVPYFMLSHPDTVQPDGALTLFSNVAEGDELVLMTGTVDTLISRAGRVAQSALKSGGFTADDISGALVTYCAGCMLTVKDQMNQVVTSINEALCDAPFLGAFTFGEQGCFVGGENRHGNLMISVALFGK